MTLKSQPLTFLRPLGRGYNMGYAAGRQKAHKALRLKGLCWAELMMAWHGKCFYPLAMQYLTTTNSQVQIRSQCALRSVRPYKATGKSPIYGWTLHGF